MKKILFLLVLMLIGITTAQLSAQATYCEDMGQTIADGSRGWAGVNFTIIGTTIPFDVKIEGNATITAGNLYRGIKNAGSPVNVYQNKVISILLDKGTSSFNWMHFAAYADWNANGTFDPLTERIIYDFNNNNVNRTHTVTVPETATLGETRIRIIFGWFTQDTDPSGENYVSPCAMRGGSADSYQPKNARAFDFIVNILAPDVTVAKSELATKITEATNLLSTTPEGTNPMQYSADSRTAMQSAIDVAQAVYDSNETTKEGAEEALATLHQAIYNYKSSQIMPFNASYETNTYWYQIGDKRDTIVYWNIATVGTTANGLNRTTTSNPTANSQLFKFVKAPYPNTGYYIYSKTDAVNALAAPSTNNGDIIRIESSTTPMSIRFENAQTGYYLIITENSNKQLNSFTDKISFYNGGSTDLGNNWKLVELDLTVLKNTYTQKRTEARDLHTATTTLEGTYFGQYSAANRSTLDGVVSAEEAKDVETLSFNQLEENISTLQSAIDTFKNSVNNNLNSLFSANPDNNRWYRIKNRNYTTYDIITSNTVDENGGIITQNSGTANDNELWRFELNAGGTAVKIVNKATGLAIKENGQSTQSTLVNLSTATEFVFSRQDIYWAIGRVNATQYQYLHRDGSSKLVGWEAIAPASHWTLQYVEETPKATRTLTVASANPGLGTAVITGTENTSATTYNPISATATATDPNYFFTNWTNAIGGAVVSSSNPFVYTGTEDLEIRANFVTNGIPVAPMASTTEHPVYYMIQSASNATHSFNNYTGDFRGNVLISPIVAGKIIHNKLSTATSTDHALWQIVNVEGVQLLKNKATGFYMTGSHSVGAAGAAANAFTFDLINGSTTQYKLRTADASGSYINTWQNNLADRLSTGDQANSLIAWHFIAPAFTGASDFSNTTDWTNGVAPTENMAVAINSNAVISADRAFSGLHIAAGKTLIVNAGKALTVYNSITGTGTLVLKSDATSGTATVTGNVSGNATVEQYLPAATERTWWYLASPVTGAAWTVFGSNQVGEYSETSRSYSAPFAATETLTAGKGYVVKMNAAQAANVYQFANKALNNGNISVPLTRTVSETLNNKRGFNLVGNPYPSYLNWELAHKASTNVRSTIWYRTKGTSAMEFHTYNAALGVSVPTAASGYIPPMQAFWVKVDTDPTEGTVSNGTLNFTNDMRGHAIQGTTTPLKAPAANSLPLLRMALSNGSTSDETVIALHENASVNFDQYDSEKMSNTGTSEVFTLAGTQELTINALPDSESSKLIPLGIRPASAGSLNLSVSELKNLDNMQIILHDNVLKTETQLSLNESHNFTTDGTATNNRFSIEFRAPGMTTGLENSNFADFNITVYSGKIQIQSPAMANGELIRVYSSNGQKIIEQTAEGNNTIIDHKLSSGIYFVKVSNYVQKIIIH